MKRIIYLFSAILCICGCAREIDWAPWSLYVIVEDSEGMNVLDKDTYEQVLSGTVLTYRGIDYELELTPETKMMAPAELNGFKIDWGRIMAIFYHSESLMVTKNLTKRYLLLNGLMENRAL